MLHLVPSHRSASAGPTGSPALSTAAPTAVQAEGPVQATPESSAPRVPAGLGVGWMRQRVPSQRSAMVTQVPEALTAAATAVQAEAEVQATEFSRVARACGRWGIGTTLHLDPFHRSESGWPTGNACGWPELLAKAPTAMQADGPGQDTLYRLPPADVIRGGLGTGTMAQLFPFQCSASSACRGAVSMPVPPTA